MRRCFVLSILVAAVCGKLETYPHSYIGGIKQPPLVPHTLAGRGDALKKQLQPEGYNNFEHGMPSFFHNELIYVDKDIVLKFTPSTGEWSTHMVRRDCGLDCPIIDENSLESGVWPDRKFHKLTFLGCHKTTNHGHMLEVDPATGNYTVNEYLHNSNDPMIKIMARHHRLEMTQYHVTYVGQDEILLYDGNTGEYRVYLVEPRLPMTLDEDPIGPFLPVASGNFSMHEQQIYIGNQAIFDYSALTGEYFIHHYDRSVTEAEKPLTSIIKSGWLDKNMQLTYIGSHQILAYYPYNGTFKAFNLTEDLDIASASPMTGPYFGYGSILTGEICVTRPNCSSCLKLAGCGWCETNAKCSRGSIAGPCHTNCTVWDYTVCPGEPCYTHTECSKCLHDPFCGWCADSAVCTEGTLAGPLFGACSFSKFSCPVYVPPVEEAEIRCDEEIQ